MFIILMNWNDKKVILLFEKYKSNNTKYKEKFINQFDGLKNFLDKRFNDNPLNYREIVERIKNKQFIRPYCRICHKPVEYDILHSRFRTYCKKCWDSGNGMENLINVRKQSFLEIYGVTAPLKLKSIYNQTIESNKKNHGGVIWNQTKEAKAYMKEKWYDTGIIQELRYKGTLKNHNKISCYKTKIEKETQSYLESIFKKDDVFYNYRDRQRYPFSCDFYIKSVDVFIEIHGYWMHGAHPFDKNNKEDLDLVEKWKSKNKKIFNQAIYTWTDLDVRKRNIAAQNNLKWISIYSNDIEETKDQIKSFLTNLSLKFTHN